MTNEEIKKVISEDTKKYRVLHADGSKEIVRLWLSECGNPCRIGKGRKHYGHILNKWYPNETADWVSLTEVSTDTDYYKRAMRNAKKVQMLLSQSGFWANIKKEIDDFLALPKDEVDRFINAAVDDFYGNIFYKSQDYPWMHTSQIFQSILSNRCFKTPNFNKYDDRKDRLIRAIDEGENFITRWTKGYDNSVEVKLCDDGIKRGWYSEEYRNCGNGHYYLLLDATHAIFYEDD